MKKQRACLLLVAPVWMLGQTSGFCTAGVPWYDDPCITNFCVVIKAPTGSITFTNIDISATIICIGSGNCATVQAEVKCSEVITESKWIAASTNCPDTYSTNNQSPFFATNWWQVTGIGVSTPNGSGKSACFTPTNCGDGTITFYGIWKDTDPCTGQPIGGGTISKNKKFTVVAVDSLNPDLAAGQGGLEDGSDPPTYWVCPCAGDVIVTASSCPSLTANQLPDCWTFTGGVEIDKLNHKVSGSTLANGPVTFTVTCGTSTRTIILKADTQENDYYDSNPPSQSCLCDNFSDPSPYHDLCGHSLAIDCVGCNCYGGINGHFEYTYNRIWVGTCYYEGGINSFLYKTTKHKCRITRTWHLTQKPTSPTFWTVTKFDCISLGAPSQNCRTSPTWDSAWARPADETRYNTGYPANSCENQGTPCSPCPPW